MIYSFALCFLLLFDFDLAKELPKERWAKELQKEKRITSGRITQIAQILLKSIQLFNDYSQIND